MVSDFQPRESYQFFLEEASELLQSLEKGLLDLRQDPSLSKIHDLMRIVHSLKGGAACVGLNHIQNLAHQLESIFKRLGEKKSEIDLELENLLLYAYDCLRAPLLEEIQIGKSNQEAALEKAQPVLARLEAKLSLNEKKKTDATEFLLAEEVAQGLSRLEVILGNPNVLEMREALKAQVEIFRKLGELSDLPDFVAIAQTTLKALQTNSQADQTIGQLALEDFRAAQEAVLAGNRHPDGNPCAALGNLALSPSFEDKVEGEETPLSSPSPHLPLSPKAELHLGVRMELDRLELLNNLVGELVTQDNRFLLQNQQHEETLEVLRGCLNRFKQLERAFQSWGNQLSSDRNGINKVELSLNKHSRSISHRDSHRSLPAIRQTLTEEIAQLEEVLQDLGLLNQGFQKILKHRQKNIKQIQTNLSQARMSPVGELLNQFHRMVRDLAVKENKQVRLKLNGVKTLVDRAILEKLYDPLVHLVRNALAHGIEAPEVRQAQGKSPQGTITISTYHRGNQTYIEVQDDGQGIDLEKIRASVIARSWLSPTDAATASKERLYEYLFSCGFSTVEQVSQLSGRGMGLSAVRLQVSTLKGSVTVTSEPRRSTTFTLRLPLTLTIIKLLVFSIDARLLAIPGAQIFSIVIAQQQQIETSQDRQFYYWQGQRIPLYPQSLLSAYRYPTVFKTSQSLPGKDWKKLGKVTLLLLSRGEQFIAVKIDQILMEQDLVIKPFNEAITPPSSLCGCTILGDGSLVPVLDGSALVEKWLQFSESGETVPPLPSSFTLPPPPALLVVDDSLTIRQTLSMTLQKGGYRVILARDGWEALAQLRQESQIQGIICDIEMPRMNGLEFLSRCRQLKGESLPIIMLTSRSSEKYRQLAQQLGATSYLTKPYVDEELLSILKTIREKLGLN